MNKLISSAGGLACAMILLLTPAAQAEQETVPKILNVHFDFKGGTVMEVTGEVPTGGYTNPQLIMVQYFKQPEDGIQDFNFVAEKPEGIVTQAFTKISARFDWQGEIPGWVKGVRIHGVGKGIKTVMLDRGDKPKTPMPKPMPPKTPPKPAPPQKGNRVIVPMIQKVTFDIQKSLPPNLNVHVVGQVPTGGFSEPKLSPAIYKTPPQDGIQDFTFTAVLPEGFVTQTLTEISASYHWDRVPSWVKGVRIHGEGKGVTTVMLDEDNPPKDPKPEPGRELTLSSAYLTQAVAGAHRFELQIQGLDTATPTGTFEHDPNRCGLNSFGDPFQCTLIGGPTFRVKLIQLRLADPSGQGRPIYKIEWDNMGVEFSYTLVGPGKNGGDYRLLVSPDDHIIHVVPLSIVRKP